MPIETIIFDMDGVLVESEHYWLQAREEFAAARGRQWTSADQNLAMGRNTVEWAAVMQQRLGIDESLDAIISEMKQRVIAHYEERMPLRDGAMEAVQLAAQHYRVGLASGSPTEIIQSVLRLTGLGELLEVVIYGDDIPLGKPAPDIYLAALAALGMPAASALGIEDSANGVRALKNAGMVAIAAPSAGFSLPPEVLALADAHIDHLQEFTLPLIKRLG